MTSPIQNFREERLDILSGTRGGPGSKAVRSSDLPDAVWQEISRHAGAKSAVLISDVAISAAGWIDGPEVTLGPGLWHIQAQVQILTDAAIPVARVCARISDATVEFSSAMQRIGPDASDATIVTVTCLISTKVKRTVGVQVKSDAPHANLKMVASCAPLSDSTETVTRILAVKLMGI